jgi:hypothetical protein
VEAQLTANDDDAVKKIFSRSLLQCLHVDLWLVLYSILATKLIPVKDLRYMSNL